MKIFVLTPIYATTTSMQGATPVVHYFIREWVKMGHEVTVFHLAPKYPRMMYWVGRHFQHQLNTRLGMLVPIKSPKEKDYIVEGVKVHRRCMKKLVPHSLYSKEQLQKAFKYIEDECERSGVPDWFIGHWDNPQLELLVALKKRFGKPTCLVLHGNDFNYEERYGRENLKMLFDIDVMGFRSKIGQRNYIAKYGVPNHCFIASSGVSEPFLTVGNESKRIVRGPIHNYVFVGSLIGRKYPSAIVSALSVTYPLGDFKMTFIGDGAEKKNILEEYKRCGERGELVFTGRIQREDIISYLMHAFVMISKNEVFGLVYLEAMALGLITIGSRDEGIDGIVKDGYNGFLCEAGNVDELVKILDCIKNMSAEQIEVVSRNAKETANKFSDKRMAEEYIKTLSLWD